MAQTLQNITLGSPGFRGVNSEDSPVGLDSTFAQRADNAVIDSYGRLGARKGFNTQTDSGELTKLYSTPADPATLVPISKIKEFEVKAGTNRLVAVGNNKLFLVNTTTTTNDTLTEFTLPLGYTITSDDWMIESFNGKMYFFQAGNDALVLNTTLLATTELDTINNQSLEASPACPQGGIVTAAFGRLWVAGVPSEPSVLYWSDLFIGEGWTEGTSGSIDLTRVWPDGYDEITGVAAHNDKLIIFGRHNIVMYQGAESPATMILYDTIAGVGCINKRTIVPTGDDVMYLSDTGLRSLGRSLQDGGSLPISDISNNVRKTLLARVATEEALDNGAITAVYNAKEAFYLLMFYSDGTVYCFDMRGTLEDGTRRVTVWPGTPFKCGETVTDGTLYMGGEYGIGTYSGYQDNGMSYNYAYESPVLTFGDTARLKLLKKIRPTFIGGSNVTATIGWGFGFSGLYTSENVQLANGVVAEYNVAEFGIGQYSGGIFVTDETVNATGSGTDVRLRISCDIDGTPFSMQEINVQALLGRII